MSIPRDFPGQVSLVSRNEQEATMEADFQYREYFTGDKTKESKVK